MILEVDLDYKDILFKRINFPFQVYRTFFERLVQFSGVCWLYMDIKGLGKFFDFGGVHLDRT